MRHFTRSIAAISASLIALSIALPLSTQAAGADQNTAIVTVNAVQAYGASTQIALPSNSPYVTIQDAAGKDLSPAANGTVSCSTDAAQGSAPGTYEVTDCAGLSVPGYSVSYDLKDSALTILKYSVTFGLIHRFLPPGTTVELNPQPLPPGAAVDVSWAARGCDGTYANPSVLAVPLQNGQQATSEAPISVPCRVNKKGVAVTGHGPSTYLVHDYCVWVDPNGQIHHYLSFLPNGCQIQIQKTTSIFDSSSDSGANIYLNKGVFKGATLVTEAPIPALNWTYSAASGSATADVDDNGFCGSYPHRPLPFPPHCDGSLVTLTGVTPASVNGTYKIASATANTITFNLNGNLPAGSQLSGGTIRFGNVALNIPSGSNMANLVLQSAGSLTN